MEETAPKRRKLDISNLISFICQEEFSSKAVRIDIYCSEITRVNWTTAS